MNQPKKYNFVQLVRDQLKFDINDEILKTIW